jgi:hypothetical protein
MGLSKSKNLKSNTTSKAKLKHTIKKPVEESIDSEKED